MKKSVIGKGWMIFFLCLYIGLFVLATFRDLTISEAAVSHANDFYVWIGDKTGTAIPTCVAGLGCAGLYHCERKEKHRIQWLWLLILVILSIVTGWLLFHHCSLVPMVIGIVITAVLYFSLLFFCGGKMDGSYEDVRKVCGRIIWDVILSMVIVNILKLIWARPRYIYMSDPESQFTPWYVINGPALVTDAYKSFPSAHTVSAGTLLSFGWLPYAYSRLKEKKKTILIISWIIILFVAVSRIFAGMHFLSDTLGGMGLAVVIYLCLNRSFAQKEQSAVD